MVNSMTAFARCQTEQASHQLVWEIRSVNHRYLDVNFKLPESVRSVEFDLREMARSRLKRGKIDCSLRVDRSAGASSLTLNRPLLQELMASVDAVQREVPGARPASTMDLLRWPGVLGDPADTAADLPTHAKALFSTALGELVKHRGREGEQLRQVIAERLSAITDQVAALRTLTDGITAALHQRLTERLEELTATLDAGRLEQEAAMLSQRADVREELDRLDIHVAEAQDTLKAKGPQGRRLDFLTQELNREANTLAAKSVLAEASSRAVDLKVIVEQIREQVQNIE